ncbi:DMT family transporter [Paenibacillus sp. SN-8-1]|uniref:DMT family transporter n=1 Tax=Paenibacillus sp. SN-8-1 TaxID=3435409 RepID=UPI003D9AA79C
MNRHWLYVLMGGIIEVVWVSGLKHSNAWWHWLITAVAIAISFWLIIEASRRLPVGTVYAVFTGIGTAGTVIGEMVVFGEPFRWSKTLLIALLLAGVMGLKLMSDNTQEEAAS